MLMQKTGLLPAKVAGSRQPTHCLCPWQQKRTTVIAAAGGERKEKKESTLSTLESLLGSKDEDTQPQDGEFIEWWRIKPSQSAPPRRNFMSPGSAGRFLLSEDFLGELRVGRKTELGEQLEVPKVQPVLSFVLFLMNFSCAVTYMNVEALQGPDGGREYLLGICNSLRGLEGGLPGLLHPLISCFQAPGPLELGLALWALAVVGPRIEASVGSLTFLAIYLMSGYSAGLTSCMLQQVQLWTGAPFVTPADATCGASASLLGMVAAMVVYNDRNSHLEGLRYGLESEGLLEDSTEGSERAAESSATSVETLGSEGGNGRGAESSSAGADRRASSLGASSSSSSSSSGGARDSSTNSSAGPPSLEDQQQDWQRRQRQLLFYLNTGVVAVGSVALALLQREGPQDGIAPVSLLPTLVGGLTGGLLAQGMGPRFYVQREAQIPEGAMFVPENTREMAMCLDMTSGLQRGLVASGATVGLLTLAQCIRFVHGFN